MTIPLVDVDRDTRADPDRAVIDVPNLVVAFGFAAAG
jgi:hypothetical protein